MQGAAILPPVWERGRLEAARIEVPEGWDWVCKGEREREGGREKEGEGRIVGAERG